MMIAHYEDSSSHVRDSSCDIGWGMRGRLPEWTAQVLERFSRKGRLFGHGVMYSPTSALWEPRQAAVLSSSSSSCYHVP